MVEVAKIDAAADGERFTDAGNANRLIKVANGHLRYVHAWDRFLIYEDGVWHLDNHKDALTTEMAKDVSRDLFEFYEQLHQELLTDRELTPGEKQKLEPEVVDPLRDWAHGCERKASIANMISMTKDPPAPHHLGRWDSSLPAARTRLATALRAE